MQLEVAPLRRKIYDLEQSLNKEQSKNVKLKKKIAKCQTKNKTLEKSVQIIKDLDLNQVLQ